MSNEEKLKNLNQQVDSLASKGKFVEAIEPLTELIRLSPNDGRLFYIRGIGHAGRREEGDRDKAISDYSEAIRLGYDPAQSYYMRAISRWGRGDIEGAIKDCTSAIEGKLKFADAYALRGQIYLTKSEWARALDDFDAALRAKPGNTTAIKSRADAILMRDRQRLHEEMEEKLQADFAKYRSEFGEDFVRRKKEQAREAEYGQRLKRTEMLIRWGLLALGELIFAVFGGLMFAVWETNDKSMPDGFFPFGFVGLVFPTALLVSPLAWWIRTLLRDKAKFAMLREDAARKQRVMEYILSTPRDSDLYGQVVLKSLDHWMRQSAADLLVDFENKRAASPAASVPEVKLPSSGGKSE